MGLADPIVCALGAYREPTMLNQRAPKKRAVTTHVLQNTIATLSDERYTITAAIDFLFTGV
jgi:hypothetical protein